MKKRILSENTVNQLSVDKMEQLKYLKIKNESLTRSEKGIFTNLATEFYILSLLARMGVNAHLTLGQKKSVDIVVEKNDSIITFDVKGLRGKTLWPLDNFVKIRNNHYIILVSFVDKIFDLSLLPEIYVVPSKNVKKLMYQNPKKSRKGINLSLMREESNTLKYLSNWKFLSK